MGAGKAVISTPLWCSEELLADDRGLIVPFKDPDAFAGAIDTLMSDPKKCNEIRKKTYEYGKSMRWPVVAKQYIRIFDVIQKERSEIILSKKNNKAPVLLTEEFPVPKLDHILTMTDDFGIFKHARYVIPNYGHGYCVDDNARAIVVASKFYRLFHTKEALELLNKYLGFIFYAQRPDGFFRNYYSVNRQPLDALGSDDCQGRALWALGYAMAYGPGHLGSVARLCFDKVIPHVSNFHMRGTAYALLGLYYYLVRFPEDGYKKKKFEELSNKLVASFKAKATKEWQWYEEKTTYANGLMPSVMWLAYYILRDKKYKDVAVKTSNFLIEKSINNNRLSIPGPDDFIKKKGDKTDVFYQQPIDALWLVEMGKFAYRETLDEKYLNLMRTSFNWFLGENDAGTTLYDHRSGGCYDGLNVEGKNLNQGAESTLSAVLSLLSITEMAHQQSVGEYT